MGGPEIALAAAVAPELIAGVSSATAAGLGAAGTAAGLGAAGTAAGTAAGLGAAGMGGGMASLFGPAGIGAVAPEVAAVGMAEALPASLSPGLAASMMEPVAASGPMVASPAPGGMGGGLGKLFGMEAAGGMGAPGMGVASSGLPWAKMAGQMGKGLLADEQKPTPHAQRPANNSQPMDSAQIMERLRRAQSQRSNWAGLLGGAGR